VRRILRLAWPPAIQMIGGFLVTVFFLRLMGEFGEKAQAAYSIGLRLSMLGPMLAFPLAGACATLVGQNLGAGKPRRAWSALGVGLAVHAGLLWSAGLALYLFRGAILGAFSRDPEVIRIGSELLVYQAGAFGAWGLYFVFLRALQGAGDVVVPMALSLGCALGLTLPLGVWLSRARGMGPTGVFTASLVGAVAVTVLTGAWLATGRWARRAGAPPG
jgi:Na+-driven multidrug efflux pump